MRLSFPLCLLFLFMRFVLAADMSGSHSEGQQLSQGWQARVQEAAKGTAPATIPGYVTDSPPQVSLNVATIEGAAMRDTQHSDAGQFLSSASSMRKRFVLDPDTDPLLKNGEAVLRDPHTILDVKLEQGAEEKGEAVTLMCEESGNSIEQACHHLLVIEIEITPGWIEEHWGCYGYEVPDYADHGGSNHSGGAKIRGYMRFSHGNDNPYCLGRCAINHQRIEHPEIITIKKEEWVEDCAHLEKLTDQGICQYVSKVCTDGPSTKMVQDRPITRDCWQFRQTYNCKYPSKNTCSGLRAQGCIQKASRCKEKVSGICVVWEQTYECPSTRRSLKNIRAGVGSPFCITGNCMDSSYQANGEMLDVIAKLSVFKEMQKDIRSGLEIFKGTDKRCSRNCIDFKDCCQNMKGWGTSLHLAACSEEERLLAQLKSKNLCHQVGTYCAKKILGICVSKKTSYCCFGNKLLRLIQQQGRAQLGVGWGDSENPCCRGLKAEELGSIDFSHIDFSEIFEDIMATFRQPDTSRLQTRAAENLKENVRQVQASLKKQPLSTGEGGDGV
jgi:hypothetical protein